MAKEDVIEMNWKHLRKQDVDRAVVSQWNSNLREAGIDITACDVDEFYDFDTDSIKIRLPSHAELVITDKEWRHLDRKSTQRLRDFLVGAMTLTSKK
jgi:hypothetical protein